MLFRSSQLSELSNQERYEKRLELSKPILDEFRIWLREIRPKVPPKSKFGEAIIYCLNHWEGLNTYLLDGRLEIDSNRALSSGLENPQAFTRSLFFQVST